MSSHAPIAFFALPQDPTPAPNQPVTERGAGAATGTATTQEPTGAPQGQPANPCASPDTLMMFGLFGLLMYFMILRPEQRRRKEMQKMMSSLQKGDMVVTSGGLHGEIAAITDTTITLKVDAVRMTFDKSAIVRVVRDEPAKGDAAKK